MDAKRREWSAVHFETLRAKPSLEVDHIAAVALWNDRPLVDAAATPDGIVNDIGNTFLLEKNLNIGKSAKPLVELLDDIHEIRDDEGSRKAFLAALAIDEVLADPSERSREEIKSAIETRGKLIRDDLAEYAKGTRTLATMSVPDVSGVWECVSAEEGHKTHELLLSLRQTGSVVEGNYLYDGKAGTVQGRLREAVLHGAWREKRTKGEIVFTFVSGQPATFTGQWTYKKMVGTWTGKWLKPVPQAAP